MSSAKDTKDAYLKAALEKDQEVNKEILFLISHHEESGEAENSPTFTLHLHGNKRNERNEMYRKRINDKDVEVFYLMLKSNTYITGLNLGYNVIEDEGAIVLGTLLKETTVLETLILSFNDIGVPGVTAIAKGLQVNDTLKVLKLDGNKLQRFGGLALADALQVNTTLEELNLNNTEQDIQSLIAFSTVLKGNCSLKIFDISRPLLNSEQEETTIHFAKMLEVNRRINEIHLSKHDMKNFGVEQFVNHVMDNFALFHLDLSCNKISRDGMKHIARFLESNPPLRLLHLGYNRAEDDGAIWLSAALSLGNMSLETLVLVSNSLTGKGLCALAECLRSNCSLKQLFIWGNAMDTPTCKAFMELTTGALPRLLADDTDVRAYVVDDVPYLARVTSPY